MFTVPSKRIESSINLKRILIILPVLAMMPVAWSQSTLGMLFRSI
jgi:hypothetical protein